MQATAARLSARPSGAVGWTPLAGIQAISSCGGVDDKPESRVDHRHALPPQAGLQEKQSISHPGTHTHTLGVQIRLYSSVSLHVCWGKGIHVCVRRGWLWVNGEKTPRIVSSFHFRK